jgi:hypothetical protein
MVNIPVREAALTNAVLTDTAAVVDSINRIRSLASLLDKGTFAGYLPEEIAAHLNENAELLTAMWEQANPEPRTAETVPGVIPRTTRGQLRDFADPAVQEETRTAAFTRANLGWEYGSTNRHGHEGTQTFGQDRRAAQLYVDLFNATEAVFLMEPVRWVVQLDMCAAAVAWRADV